MTDTPDTQQQDASARRAEAVGASMKGMLDELLAERAKVARVRAIHTLGPRTNSCNEDGLPWPCPTIAALGDGRSAGAQPDAERCTVCGSDRVIHQVVTPERLCGGCFLCRCGETPCVRTGINDRAVSATAAAPHVLLAISSHLAAGAKLADALREALGADQ